MSDKQQTHSALNFSELQAWVDAGEPSIAQPQVSDVKLATLATQGQQLHPLAVNAEGQLGSRTVGSVVLQTGQLNYHEELIELAGNMALQLSAHYLSQSQHQGILGSGWRFRYESRFEQMVTDQQFGYRLTTHNGQRFEFIYDKALNRLVDQSLQAIEVSWDDAAQDEQKQFSLRYPDGQVDIYQNSSLIEQRDRNGNTIHLQYSAQGLLTRVVNSSGAHLQLEYNDQHLVACINDHGKRTWWFDYTDQGVLSCIKTPSNGRRDYRYSQSNSFNQEPTLLLAQIKNSLSQTLLAIEYVENGQVSSVDTLDNGRIRQTFDYNYRRSSVSVATEHGDNMSYHLDDYGLINRIRYPNGFVRYHQWQKADNSAVMGDCNGINGSKQFDHKNRLLTEHNEQGQTTYEYPEHSINPSRIEGPKGIVLRQQDARGNILNHTDELGNTEHYQYDESGNCIRYIDSAGIETQYQYNQMGLMTCETDAQDNSLLREYDELGRECKIVDPQGRTSQIEYTVDDQPFNLVDGLQNTVSIDYDTESRVIGITDPAGNKTVYAYDDQGRVIGQRSANGDIVQYRFQHNDLKTVILADGTHIDYQYADNGRQVTETIAGQSTVYQYDWHHRLISARSATSYITQSYNNTGELQSQSQNGQWVERAYRNKNLAYLGVDDQEIIYRHNHQGKLQSIALNNQDFVHQEYNHLGQLTQRVYPNQQKEQYQYSPTGHLEGIQTGEQSIDYTTDGSGLITQKNDIVYQYDAAGRITKAGSSEYQYDKLGNITQHTIADNTEKSINRFDPKTNQLLETDHFLIKYDQRGNLISKADKRSDTSVHYSYNPLNQLIKISGESYDHVSQLIEEVDLEFAYDAIGRRCYKRDGATQYSYTYDQFDIIQIQKTLADNPTQTIHIVHDEEVDTPISICNEHGTFYYHRDHQGSIIALTNSSGDVVETMSYDDCHGTVIAHQKSIETDNPYCYTGREWDAPDLYYYRARYYDPGFQRFLTLDPIGFESGDYNHYRYVANNPVNFNDPSGLAIVVIPLIEGAIVWLGSTSMGAAITTAGTTVTTAFVVHGQKIANIAPKVVNAVRNFSLSTLFDASIDTPMPAEQDKSKETSRNNDIPVVDAGAKVKGNESIETEECQNAKENKRKNCGGPDGLETKFSMGNQRKSPSGLLTALKRKPARVLKHINCLDVETKIQQIQACLLARKNVTDECYDGITDESHAEQEADLNDGLRNLAKIKRAMGCP